MKKNKTLATAKSLPIAAIIFSMMIFPANANALAWDIIKEFASGVIKTVVMPKSAKIPNAVVASKPATTTDSKEAPKSGSRSPEEIFATLDGIYDVCRELSKSVPCAVGPGKWPNDKGKACKEAKHNALVNLAENIGTYVESSAELKDVKDEDGDILKVATSYVAEAKLTTQQLVNNTQEYFCYTYIDEELTEINKKTVYIATSVVVMNRELFGKTVDDMAKEKPISEQIINDTRKGIVSFFKVLLNRK